MWHLRFAGLKSLRLGASELGGSGQHTARERVTLNADPEKDNIRLIGVKDGLDLETTVRAFIGDQKIRKNAVLAVEVLLSASPEYFRPDAPTLAGVFDRDRLDEFSAASTKWLFERYGDKVVRAEIRKKWRG